jgi:hypothetical protein
MPIVTYAYDECKAVKSICAMACDSKIPPHDDGTPKFEIFANISETGQQFEFWDYTGFFPSFDCNCPFEFMAKISKMLS